MSSVLKRASMDLRRGLLGLVSGLLSCAMAQSRASFISLVNNRSWVILSGRDGVRAGSPPPDDDLGRRWLAANRGRVDR